METKSWYLSKTLWLNILGGVVVLVQYLQGQPWFDPELQVLILAILNAVMRFITNKPLSK